MAVITNGVGGSEIFLERTTGLMDIQSPYTVMGWFLFTTAPTGGATNSGSVVRGSLAIPALDAVGIVDVAGTSYFWLLTNGPSSLFEQSHNSAVSTNTWYHFALVRSTTTQLLGYLNGVLDITLNHTDASSTYGASTYERFGGESWTGLVAAYKGWQRALTAAEILQEMQTLRPTALGDVWTWGPVFPTSGERTRDYSGNGRNWVEFGTVTDGDPPPVSYGAPVLWVNAPAAVVVPPPRYSWVPELGPLLAQ